MKRTIVLLRLYAGAGSMLLMLSFVLVAGCSERNDDGQAPSGKYGLSSQELIALKKANKNPKDYKKALRTRQIEQLREEGVAVTITPSGKSPNKPR